MNWRRRGIEELVDRQIGERQPNHDRGQRGTDEQHDDQRRHQQRRIDQNADDAFGQQRLDWRDRTNARQEIADVAALEVAEWQSQQMADDIAAELEGERLAEREDDPVAQSARDRTDRIDRAKADQQDGEQARVALADRLIDDELDEEGCQQGQELDHQREHENLGERTPEVAEAAPQIGEPRGDLGIDRFERGGRGQLERDAGEVGAQLGDRDAAAATGRIDDRRDPAGDALQHYEMVHIPVQDGGLLKLVELVQLEPDRARCKLQI